MKTLATTLSVVLMSSVVSVAAAHADAYSAYDDQPAPASHAYRQEQRPNSQPPRAGGAWYSVPGLGNGGPVGVLPNQY